MDRRANPQPHTSTASHTAETLPHPGLSIHSPIPLTRSALHLRQYHTSSFGSSSMRRGGSRHIKWKLRGHPSQHRKRPMPRHTEQKSWLTKFSDAGAALPLPLPLLFCCCVPLFATRADPPTRLPLPEALTPERSSPSRPREDEGVVLRSRSRRTRPALGPTIVWTSAATSFEVLSLKMDSAWPAGAPEAGCGVLRDEGTELPSRLAGVEVAPGELLRALTPRRGRVLGVGGAGLVT